ncbi:hypothetical protein SK803_35980 [Lentzea sp. BCCO 10_0856]|uniref:Immunity protein 53 n=1 Tax=Lentzea miocenica TaxID=3095431 RepID=A0ABU4TBS3_9PSEU|nr:hypothetical protein [Lentzea sp. BCCO 10_0856]MDX8035632.1 hypothetical protein [Lentzea sp. BCCO 10_0856]
MRDDLPDSFSRAHRLEAWNIAGDLLGTWEGSAAAAVLELVAAFPAGEGMRCFNPGYAIWAYAADDSLLFDLEFCYRCNWVGVREPGHRQRLVPFDPKSVWAEELLARFQAFELPPDLSRAGTAPG